MDMFFCFEKASTVFMVFCRGLIVPVLATGIFFAEVQAQSGVVVVNGLGERVYTGNHNHREFNFYYCVQIISDRFVSPSDLNLPENSCQGYINLDGRYYELHNYVRPGDGIVDFGRSSAYNCKRYDGSEIIVNPGYWMIIANQLIQVSAAKNIDVTFHEWGVLYDVDSETGDVVCDGEVVELPFLPTCHNMGSALFKDSFEDCNE